MGAINEGERGNQGMRERRGPTTLLVEFNIPANALRASDGVTGKIFGPNSIFGPKLGISEMPTATEILQTASKIAR